MRLFIEQIQHYNNSLIITETKNIIQSILNDMIIASGEMSSHNIVDDDKGESSLRPQAVIQRQTQYWNNNTRGEVETLETQNNDNNNSVWVVDSNLFKSKFDDTHFGY